MLSDEALLEFYDRAVDPVYRYAIRLTAGDRARAQDLVQETFLTLVRQVRAGRVDAVDIGWAIATCRSRFIDQLRRAEVEGRALRRVEQRPQPSSANSGAFDALAQVPDNQRTALILRYVDDLTVAQVAREMKRSVRATESLLSRGRDSLRTAYGEGAQ